MSLLYLGIEISLSDGFSSRSFESIWESLEPKWNTLELITIPLDFSERISDSFSLIFSRGFENY